MRRRVFLVKTMICFHVLLAHGQNFTFQDSTFHAGDIMIGPVYFEYNSCVIQAQSVPLLDSLVVFLDTHQSLTMEMGNPTDERRGDHYSFGLTERRAKAIAEYLIGKGINPKGLVWLGYEGNKPIKPNAKT